MDNNVPVYKIFRNIASEGMEFTREIQDWLNDSEGNKKIYHDLFTVWKLTGKFPEHFTPDRIIAWQKVKKQIHPKNKNRPIYFRLLQSAAAVIIVILSIWLGAQLDDWRQPKYSVVISPKGQKTRIVLPDSSIVLLNGGSQIRYRNNFGEKGRNVELTGEGFFEVRKDLSHRFVVATSGLNVQVFGTTFNIKAYENDQTVEVALLNGHVGITRNKKEIAALEPGQMATFHKIEKQLDIQEINCEIASAWTNEELVFEEKTLVEIVKYLERWYGVDIEIDPDLLDGEIFTFKVKTESFRELLKLISFLKPIKYDINGKKVIITKP